MALSTGDFLVYDGTQWQNQPSTGGSFSVDSPTFYVDTVNHRVGIGTTSPVGHVSTRRPLILADTSHDASFEVWGTLGGKAFLESVAGDAYMGSLAAGTGTGNLYFLYGNASNGMIILGASGNVGIGTTNPVGHLSTRQALILAGTSNDATFELWGTVGGKGFIESVNGETYMGNLTAGTGAGNLHLAYGNGTDGIVILGASGNVGIGTSTPGSRLHVAGPITRATNPQSGAYTITATDSIVFVDATGGAITITLPAASSSTIGREYTVYRVNAAGGNVTVAANAGNTINGTAVTTAQWQAIKIVGYTSTSWIARLL